MKGELNMKRKEMVELVAGDFNITFATLGNRYAYFAFETSKWYWVTVKDLKYAIVLINNNTKDAYSHWCNGTIGGEVSERTKKKYKLHW